MKPKWLALSAFSVFIYLIIVNVFVFPIVFPDGLAEKFLNTRSENLPLFHLLAFAATALLLTVMVDRLVADHRPVTDGILAGVLLGLLVALPEHLHLYAMVEATAVKQIIPVLWTISIWGLAGLIVGMIRGKVYESNG